MKSLIFAALIIISVSCSSQDNTAGSMEAEKPTKTLHDAQIGQYVVETFQDTNGNLWFGTLEKGVAKYDGTKLTYLTVQDGLPDNRITNVIEDALGNLWFGTGAGISRLTGDTFTNYTTKDGLCSNMISNLFIDSKGTFWIGTWGGVCTFDGATFSPFPLPYPPIETTINPDTKDWITSIMEDTEGNIWFGRDGYGASRFNGHTFVHLITAAGLNSNNVQSITEDNNGSIWIGTRVAEKDNPDPNQRFGKGGLNKFDGDTFVHFPTINGLHDNDVYSIYKDTSGDLWISTVRNGVYQYTDDTFTQYPVPTSTMSFLKDRKGTIWLGCAGGLYKIDTAGNVVNVKVDSW